MMKANAILVMQTFACVVLLMFIILGKAFDGPQMTYIENLNMPIGRTLVLNCSKDSKSPANWEYNGTTLYINRIPTKAIYRKTLLLLDDYSLQISSLTVKHGGVYKCFVNSSLIKAYVIEVEVQPMLEMYVNGEKSITRVYLEQNKETSVNCVALGSFPFVNLTYNIYHEEALVVNYSVSQNPNYPDTYDTVYDILFVPRRANGTIQCVSSDQYNFPGQTAHVDYITYAIPIVHLIINNQQHGAVVNVNMLDVLTAVCSSFGVRPNNTIRWIINDVPANRTKATSNTSIYHSLTDDYTYNSTSYLTYRPTEVNGSIACVSELDYVNIVQFVEAKYLTYVIPTVELTINQQINDGSVVVEEGSDLYIMCRVQRSRPAVVIKWFLDAESFVPPRLDMDVTRKQNDETFDLASSFVLQFRRRSGNVTCICEGLPTGQLQTHASFLVTEIIGTQHSLLLILGFVVMSTILLFTSIVCIIIYCTGVRDESHVSNPVTLSDTSTCVALKVDESSSHAQTDSLIAKKNEDLVRKMSCSYKPPIMSLPSIPGSSTATIYSGIPEEKYGHYYSAVKENLSHDRLLQRKDVCFILEMKSGTIYTRWMGTIALSTRKKCVVLTTVTETDEFHWDMYVKRLLDLPTSKNITTMEGICIDGANLYVVNEHVTCETLETVIDSNQQNRESIFIDRIASHDWTMTSYIMDILEGLECIQSYGFLHPGLSLRKVLVTTERVCKLYDFCLTEDATHRIKIMKSKERDCTLNDLPPESRQRSEYTQASDVWSVAAVICKIIYQDDSSQIGSLTESTCDTLTLKLTKASPTSPFLRLESLTECYSHDSEQRPTISTLTNVLRQEIDDTQTYDTTIDPLSDTYVPMEALAVVKP